MDKRNSLKSRYSEYTDIQHKFIEIIINSYDEYNNLTKLITN